MASSSSASARNYETDLRIGRQLEVYTTDHTQSKILEVSSLADKMKFEIEQHNGQRFFGPPIHFRMTPKKDCEVFVGCIPKYIFEDQLVPLLSLAGKLYQFRLMMDFNGFNRGFGFAMFMTPEEASEACRLLNMYKIAPNRHIVVTPCQDNNALYIGGILHISPEEIVKRVFDHTPSVTEMTVSHPDPYFKRYAVLRFRSHREAALARRFYLVSNYQIWNPNCQIIVDWKSRHNIEQPTYLVAVKEENNVSVNYVNPGNIAAMEN